MSTQNQSSVCSCLQVNQLRSINIFQSSPVCDARHVVQLGGSQEQRHARPGGHAVHQNDERGTSAKLGFEPLRTEVLILHARPLRKEENCPRPFQQLTV